MNRRTKSRLLLIGTKSADRSGILKILEARGFDVLLSETEQQALMTLQDYLIDGVILDYGTPLARYASVGSNSRMLEAITNASPFLPIVLIGERTVALGHAESLMADMILVKPIEPHALLDAVDTVLHETLRERAQRKGGFIAVLR